MKKSQVKSQVKSQGGEMMSKSSSISNLSQARPRSTSLTRSQSQRLGQGAGARVMSVGRGSTERVVRPRSSTIGSNNNVKGGA